MDLYSERVRSGRTLVFRIRPHHISLAKNAWYKFLFYFFSEKYYRDAIKII